MMIFLPELAVNVVSIARNNHSIKSSKKSQDISIISIKSERNSIISSIAMVEKSSKLKFSENFLCVLFDMRGERSNPSYR